MDFQVAPTLPDHTNLVVTTFQTAGTLLIALLLRLLTRDIPTQFLSYWASAWVALATALVCLNLSYLITPHLSQSSVPWIRRPAQMVYMVSEYAFGFYLWAGCRAYAKGTTLSGRNWWLFAVPAAFGLTAPMFLPSLNTLFPFHAAIFGGFCLLALLATRGCSTEARQTLIGVRLTQAALVGLTLLFWHYSLVKGWRLMQTTRPDLEYLEYGCGKSSGVLSGVGEQ